MSEFEKELVQAIEKQKAKVLALENLANVTRDFPAALGYSATLKAERKELVSREAALEAYRRVQK